MDRMIRLYNPYMPARPIAHLRRHTTPIFFIHLSIEDDRIFTMSTDKCLNVVDFLLILTSIKQVYCLLNKNISKGVGFNRS